MGLFGNSLIEDVIDFLEEIKINESEFTTEKELETLLINKLKNEFPDSVIHRQFNVEGYIAQRIDIDIDEEVGIELKLAKDLSKANQIHRLFGQAVYYDNRKYKGDLIIA